MKLRSVISHAALKVAMLAGMMSFAGADAGAVDDPCQLKFKKFASRRFVLDNELTLAGSADRACHVYEYPSMKLHGDIDFDLPPWSAECPNGRVWATLAVLPEGYPSRYVFLTMDRVNFPGIPNPNWTYGALYLYYGYPKVLAGASDGR